MDKEFWRMWDAAAEELYSSGWGSDVREMNNFLESRLGSRTEYSEGMRQVLDLIQQRQQISGQSKA